MTVSSRSRVRLATPRAAARQAPLSLGLSGREHWGGGPFPSPGDLPDPGTEPGSQFFPNGAVGEAREPKTSK